MEFAKDAKYIFKSSCSHIGYLEINSDGGFLYIDKNLFPIKSRFWWDEIGGLSGLDCSGHAEESKEYQKKLISLVVRSNAGSISSDIFDFMKFDDISGCSYFRTNRGSPDLYKKSFESKSFIDEFRSFYNIYQGMEDIFKVVEPRKENLDSFGHKIREVLTIACTEVEYLLRQYLVDNKYGSGKDRFTTKDYVSVLPCLRLNEFSVQLSMHPELGVFSPFKDWSLDSPTKSLNWYDSYNAAKHDRGNNFQRASLKALVNSVAAIHILLVSQYGVEVFINPLFSKYESCFDTHSVPEWPLNELFFPSFSENDDINWLTDVPCLAD